MVLPALGPEPTRHGSIHGGVAGHFLHGVAPSAVMSTSEGPTATLALARAAALLLLSAPLPGLLLLLLLLSLLLSLLLLLVMLHRFGYTSVG